MEYQHPEEEGSGWGHGMILSGPREGKWGMFPHACIEPRGTGAGVVARYKDGSIRLTEVKLN